MIHKTCGWIVTLAFVGVVIFSSEGRAQPSLLISEFMASNTRILADEDGEFSDWIEIHNPGTNPVNLDGWFLTDATNNLTKWRFPATNLNAGAYLVVFASNKDRRVPGARLHTDFRLTGSGEYLALVQPDGTNIASAFSPAFPAQVPDVSYGLGQGSVAAVVVATNGAARALVPASGALGVSWTDPAFPDGDWLQGTNGVGFEFVPGEPGQTGYGSLITTDIRSLMQNQNASAYVRLPFLLTSPAGLSGLTLEVRYDDGFAAYLNGALVAYRNAPVSGEVANSETEFSGVQGQNNWFYGYYNKTADANGTYQAADFTPFAVNAWNGSIWDLAASTAPWTELNPQGGHPNGSNNGNVHWAVRRWQSEVNGTVRVTLHLAKSNVSCGTGITGRILHNGVPVFTQAVAFSDAVGVITAVTITNVVAGDFLDFAIDPTGTDGGDADPCDGTIFTAMIEYVASDLVWNTAAPSVRSNSVGRLFETIELNNATQWLIAGTNVLAVHGLNAHATNADFLIQPVLKTSVSLPITNGVERYFSLPTPGGPNGTGADNLGPIITETTHAPAQPLDNQDLSVTARIAQSFAPVVSNTLVYRVMFGAEVRVPMVDDGTHGDGAAGDGVFGAVIPASAATTDQLIRWYIAATDSDGRSSRWPFFTNPTLTPQYLGTVVANPTLTNPLPVLHWFVENPTAATTAAGTRGSLYFLGEFYDNISFNLHGQSSTGFPKKSYDVEFNTGYRFTYRRGQEPVRDVNMLTTYPDKAHMRNILTYGTYEALGNPYHWVEPVRVHQNGSFFGVWHLVENGNDDFIARLGLDPNNPLYKMYNTFNSTPSHAAIGSGDAEKKSRKWEGNADLLALLNGVLTTGETRRRFLYDNLDIPQILNSIATRVISGDQDCCHKNYYFYRDTMGNREWQVWPWDVDLSYGRRWISALTYWDDAMVLDTRMPVGDNNGLLAAVYTTPEMDQMYWRRQRTLMDEFLQAPGTPTNQLRLERRIEELVPVLAPDAALDLAKWGTWCCGGAGPYTQATIPQPINYQTLRQAADLMKEGYLANRRTYLFSTMLAGGAAGGKIPPPQPVNARAWIAAVEASPSSGNQDQEYLVITNINSYAVDISGWRLQGAISHTFKPGTVIPTSGVLYVSPDVNAFRARTSGPRGGQGLFVQGNYQGRLSTRGESIRLLNQHGLPVDEMSYPGVPSPAQQYLRVTEIMYHPAPYTGSTNGPDEFEYIELKNIGAVPLDLTGVRFTNGINFSFTGSSVTHLAPGATVLVVRNLSAFSERYGASVPASLIAGACTNYLNNGGERLRLLDASNEEILDFDYNNTWHPVTAGFGFSLVVVDELAQPEAWGQKSQWRPSGQNHGSPGQGEPAPSAMVPVIITEALTRSESPPPTDSIEVHNPTTNSATIGGWYLSDDFNLPKKFRIPDGAVIPPGGYRTFDEADFNAGGAGFALGSDGDEVWLFSADLAGNLTGYFHGFNFGAADNGVTFGRLLTSEGREHFVAQSTSTLGSANAGPRIGPVVITEIMYRPLDGMQTAGLLPPVPVDNALDEYVEICNISASPVPLFDPTTPTNTWRLSGGVDFKFPTNAVLAPGAFALLVNFDPADAAALAAFQTRFNVDGGLPIFGPYNGKLNNDADDVELRRPTLLAGTTPAFVLVDKVDYHDQAPWPAMADGLGPSLQRLHLTEYGNDPANWTAAAPSAGTGLAGGLAPVILVQPTNSLTSFSGQPTVFSLVAAGAGPLRYQWLFNGATIAGATNSGLMISSAEFQNAGTYAAIVFNDIGAVLSSNLLLSVLRPVAPTQQPATVLVRVRPEPTAAPTTNAIFNAGAFSENSPVRFQWLRDGVPLAGKTNATLTVVNVTTNDMAAFACVVSDSVSSVQTTNAMLYPLILPVFHGLTNVTYATNGSTITTNRTAVNPVLNAATNSLVNFGVRLVAGFPPPFTYEWRRNSGGIAPGSTNVSYDTSSFYTIQTTNTAVNTLYRVVVKNLASTSGVQFQFNIITQLDFDGDGLPDPWEAAYGLNTNSVSDAGLDLDGDSMSTWQEYVAGTDPTNALSYFKIDALTQTNGTRLEFMAMSNRTYTVEYTEVLGAASWNRLTDLTAYATNHLETLVDPAGGTNRFYRLVVPRRP